MICPHCSRTISVVKFFYGIGQLIDVKKRKVLSIFTDKEFQKYQCIECNGEISQNQVYGGNDVN